MAWENGRYYTRSRKLNGRVIREYVGGGQAGELAAKADAIAREEREHSRELWRIERDQTVAFDEAISNVCEVAEIIAHAAMVAAGFHCHHGEWRRRRVRNNCD